MFNIRPWLTMQKQFWSISTKHLEKNLLFNDSQDFIVGMNSVAVQSFKAAVNVLSFNLMSNHAHFLVECGRESAELFINTFKADYSRYYQKKYGVSEIFRRNKVDIRPVSLVGEELERHWAYIQMNSVAANVCSHPFEYPWGTGSCFFQPTKKSGRRVGDLSVRRRRSILRTKTEIPSGWLLCDLGYIIPESYVCVKFMEARLRTPNRMNYFLNSSSKAKMKMEAMEDGMPAFRDQVVKNAIPDLCRTLFGVNDVHLLNENQLTELMRQIRYRFSAGANQIARVTGQTYQEAVDRLNRP